MKYRIPLDALPFAIGVRPRTIRRWIASGLLDVAVDGTVDDLEAQAVRDAMRARQKATRFGA